MASNLPPEVNGLLASLAVKIILLMVGMAFLKPVIGWLKSPKRKRKRGGESLRSVNCWMWKVGCDGLARLK